LLLLRIVAQSHELTWSRHKIDHFFDMLKEQCDTDSMFSKDGFITFGVISIGNP
jgi:hypothetical protein